MSAPGKGSAGRGPKTRLVPGLNVRSAIRTEPVGPRWIFLTLDLPGNVRAPRRVGILHEAIATGGDARRLCDLCGISIQAATHDANAPRHF